MLESWVFAKTAFAVAPSLVKMMLTLAVAQLALALEMVARRTMYDVPVTDMMTAELLAAFNGATIA
jgi:hypothetical protein